MAALATTLSLMAGPSFSGVTLMPEKPGAVEYDPKTGFPITMAAFLRW